MPTATPDPREYPIGGGLAVRANFVLNVAGSWEPR